MRERSGALRLGFGSRCGRGYGVEIAGEEKERDRVFVLIERLGGTRVGSGLWISRVLAEATWGWDLRERYGCGCESMTSLRIGVVLFCGSGELRSEGIGLGPAI